jgi:hypothetical protein
MKVVGIVSLQHMQNLMVKRMSFSEDYRSSDCPGRSVFKRVIISFYHHVDLADSRAPAEFVDHNIHCSFQHALSNPELCFAQCATSLFASLGCVLPHRVLVGEFDRSGLETMVIRRLSNIANEDSEAAAKQCHLNLTINNHPTKSFFAFVYLQAHEQSCDGHRSPMSVPHPGQRFL